MNAHGCRALELERSQLRARRVVDDDRPVKSRARVGRRTASSSRRPARALEAARDHDRMPLGRHSQPLELVDDGGDRFLARVAGRTRQREGAGLDDDRHAATPGDEIGEARSGQRVAERLADRGGDVAQRIERRRRSSRTASSSTVTSGTREPERRGMRVMPPSKHDRAAVVR